MNIESANQQWGIALLEGVRVSAGKAKCKNCPDTQKMLRDKGNWGREQYIPL